MDENQLANTEKHPCDLAANEEVSLLREASSLRSRLAFDMASAARKAGIKVETSNLVFVSRDDLVLASAAVAGLDTLDLGKLENGANVFFIYLSAQESAPVAPGFYSLRVSGSQDRAHRGEATQGDAAITSAWRCQFFDVNGNFVAALPARVEESGPANPTSSSRVRLTGAVTQGGCIIDLHLGRLHIYVVFE